MKRGYRFAGALCLFVLVACAPPTEDKLSEIREDVLHFVHGEEYLLPSLDSARTIVYLAAYPPTRDRDQLSRQQEALHRLFRNADLGAIYIVERPTAHDLVRPLADEKRITVRPFSPSSGPDLLDQLLEEATGSPTLVLSSTANREMMITTDISPEWKGWSTNSEYELGVVIHHPNAGIQLMKFPY